MNSRVQVLRKTLAQNKIDALLISSPALIIYLTGYYGFSSYEREAYLLITHTEQFIITDGRYTEAVKEYIPHFTLLERTHSFKELLKQFISNGTISSLGFEENNITVSEHKMFSVVKGGFSPIYWRLLLSAKVEE